MKRLAKLGENRTIISTKWDTIFDDGLRRPRHNTLSSGETGSRAFKNQVLKPYFCEKFAQLKMIGISFYQLAAKFVENHFTFSFFGGGPFLKGFGYFLEKRAKFFYVC